MTEPTDPLSEIGILIRTVLVQIARLRYIVLLLVLGMALLVAAFIVHTLTLAGR